MLGAIVNNQLPADATRSNGKLKSLIDRIVVQPDRLEFALAPSGIAKLLRLSPPDKRSEYVIHSVAVRLVRTGQAVRFVQGDGAAASKLADPAFARLLVRARRWWSELADGQINIPALAKREKISAGYITRVVRLAFLAPDVVEAILAGSLRAGIDGVSLFKTDAVPLLWREQVASFLPA